MADERLKYFIEALWRGRADVQAARRDLDSLGDTGKKTADNVGRTTTAGDMLAGTMRGLVQAGVVVAAGHQLLQFGRDSIATASDVEEMRSKFDTVFGGAGGGVTAQLNEFAEAANRSIYDLQGFAATLQDTFVPLGFTREAAADMSVEAVKLAEHLASFNNLQTAQVVQDIQSALVGNTEPMRKYGVVASQAAIEQEALSSSIWSGVEAITAQEKALAIYELMLKATTDAQGDAIRTADSFANQQKGLEAALTDLQVVIVQALIPAATDMVEMLAQLADQATTSAQAVSGGMAASVEDLVRANVTGASTTDELREEYQKLTDTWDDAGVWGRLLTGTTDELNEGFGQLALRVIETSGSYAEFEERGAEVFGTSGELNRALEQLADNYVIVTGNIAPTNEELFRFYTETAQAQEQAGMLAEQMGRVAEQSLTTTENLGLVNGAVDLATVEFDDLALVVGNATDATTDLHDALREFAKEQYRSSVQVDGLDSALRKARQLRQELTGVRSTRSGERVDVGGGTGATSGKAEARAMGGPVMAGRPYLVGERGPELMVPATSGAVVPNNQLGGVTIQINNPVFGAGTSPAQIEAMMRQAGQAAQARSRL